MKEIPNTKGYYATEDGRVYKPDKTEVEYYINGDGYITTMVVLPDESFATKGVHRLILTTFHGEPKENQQGNHIDGDITNNKRTNLDWVTPEQNNTHAALLNRYSKRPLIVISKQNEVKYLNNFYHACEFFSCEIVEVWNSIKEGSLLDGWKVEHLKSSDKRVQKLRRHEREQKSNRIKVSCMDLFTGEIKEFPTMASVSKHFKCKSQTVSQCISTDVFPKLFQKHYVLIESTNNFNFLTDKLKKKLLSRAPKKVLAVKKGEKIYIFETAYQFRTINNLSKKVVTTALKRGVTKIISGWKFYYLETITEEQRKELLDWAKSTTD